ncbi:ATP-binding cassette domain-containing protein [Lactococcus laudensis]|uniref:ATP-binding cassette domain-containing protein n=1 Tax=Pseudolactococcus laudensis TaxID=1494461 RepID=A0A7V8N289_9LACT|nr:multiple monosaccharide ABC transporter ATP-binding protein [Lactococcus laudensis]MBA0017360.1 ATP-binding cassette domain-containing protein [Lactococcus laudensis]MBW9282127.1 ATP-binding cassette domain-containing protein [Lactococcus laudensis]
MAEIMLEMKGIIKDFSGVKALNNVNVKVERGEIHSLCGENVAGKSTLMKVLSGVYPYGDYQGDIIYKGKTCQFKNIKDSESQGIVIIHQELALIPQLSIAENIFLGNEVIKHGRIDWDEMFQRAKLFMKIVGLFEDPNTLVENIGVGKQQLVEIAKAISKDVKLLILDEPTAALNEDDSENLLQLLLKFKSQGITCIIISHKLNEVMEVADKVTIIRDGQSIDTLEKGEGLTEDTIIKGMVGRSLDNRYPEYTPTIGDTYFEVKNWDVFHPIHSDRQVIKDANFSIKRGEIIGIAGLMGAGRTELAKSIFGRSYGSRITGQVLKEGKPIKLNTVKQAIANGLAYVTEDRKGDGLVLIESINENISLASLNDIAKYTILDKNQEIKNSESYKRKMNIKSNDIFQVVGSLSGGNQQKVVLAKWMLIHPDVLFLDEPTRGIDVGAKYEIYAIIQEMSKAGKAVCIISSELPELLGMCNRIYTMNEGKITGEVAKENATQENLMQLMTKNEVAV